MLPFINNDKIASVEISARDGMGSNGAVSPTDYQLLDTSIRFAPNQRRQIVAIDIVSDSMDEDREVFTLHLEIVNGSGKVNPLRGDALVEIEDHPGLY